MFAAILCACLLLVLIAAHLIFDGLRSRSTVVSRENLIAGVAALFVGLLPMILGGVL